MQYDFNYLSTAPAAGANPPFYGYDIYDFFAATDTLKTSVSPALIDLSTVTAALAGKLSNTSTVPNGLIDLSTVTTALSLKADASLYVPYNGATSSINLGAYGVNTSSDISAPEYQINGSTVLSVTQSGINTILGFGAGLVNSGGYNSFIGGYSGNVNTTGFFNSFLGGKSGYANTTGSYNTFIGHYSGYSNTIGERNTFYGESSGLYNTTGQYNSYFGKSAGLGENIGSGNTAIGYYSGLGISGQSYSSSTLLGYYTGKALTTGNDNILIGWQAGDTLTTGSDNLIIGYNVQAPAVSSSNYLDIGGLITGDMSIGSATVQGNLYATKFYGNGTGITGIVATDSTKVLKTGDTMSGQLTVQSSITATGNIQAAKIGVGMPPVNTFDIQGNVTDAHYIHVSSASGASVFEISKTGYVGISTEAPNYPLDVAGATQIQGQAIILGSATITGNGGIYGLSVSSNVYVVGYSSAAKYYGDGSALTGLSGAAVGASNTFTATNTFTSQGTGATYISSANVTGMTVIGSAKFTATGTSGVNISSLTVLGNSLFDTETATTSFHGYISVGYSIRATVTNSIYPTGACLSNESVLGVTVFCGGGVAVSQGCTISGNTAQCYCTLANAGNTVYATCARIK